MAPPISVFVRGRSEARSVDVAPPAKPDPSIACQPVETLAEYSKDGALLAVVEAGAVRVLSADGGAQVFSQPRPQVQALSLSPRGTFLLTWERLPKPDDAAAGERDVGNLRVWRVATGELACHWHQKVLGEKALWPAIAWSVDEELAYRLVTNEVHFFDGQAPTQAATQKLRIEGITQAKLEPTGAPHHIATFVPEKKGAPAVLRIWTHGDYGEGRFLATKSFYKADQVDMLWNPKGGSLLVHTSTEVDKTGKSYMGETGLYYMPRSGKVQNVTLRKEGPIHDVQWSPLGDEFICIFGASPPEACIFNLACQVTHSFGESPRNTVSWSPHGRFLTLAGFGNMSGELSFWDRKTLKSSATVDAHMTVAYGWSPDSRYFLTAILFPRLRVDNGYRVWSAAGGLLHGEKLEELSVAMWRPAPSEQYAAPDESDLKMHPPAAGGGLKPTSTAKKYVPPGQRAAGGGGLSLADLAIKHGGGGAGLGEDGGRGGPHGGGGRSLSTLSAAMEGGSVMRGGGPPPGSEPADAAAARNAAKNKAKREAKKANKGEVPAAPAAAAAPPPPAAADGAETEEKVVKKIRTTEKKLRQISELKELKAGGKPLEATQLSKIEGEPAVQAELAALQLKLQEVTAAAQADKWR